jgi:pyruvate dehydrogenase E1 component alpha subunit
MGVLTEDDADKIEQKIKQELEEAVKFAEESPLPAPEETLEDVYA